MLNELKDIHCYFIVSISEMRLTDLLDGEFNSTEQLKARTKKHRIKNTIAVDPLSENYRVVKREVTFGWIMD